VISYRAMLVDGLIAGLCVVGIYFILSSTLSYFLSWHKPNLFFALGLGSGNMLLPMWNRYQNEKKLKNKKEEFEHVIKIIEEIEIKGN